MTRRSPESRRRAETRGRRAEAVAALWLQVKGWRILDRRARTGAGEIDLVARRGGVLAFVEVKARSDLETARAAVSPRHAERLLRAGALWRARRGRACEHLSPRFDLVLVAPWRRPRHLEGVIRAEGRALDLI